MHGNGQPVLQGGAGTSILSRGPQPRSSELGVEGSLRFAFSDRVRVPFLVALPSVPGLLSVMVRLFGELRAFRIF